MGHRIRALSGFPHTEHDQQVVQPADHDWDDILQEAERNAHNAYEMSDSSGFLNAKLNQIHEKAQSKLSAMKAIAHSRELGIQSNPYISLDPMLLERLCVYRGFV